MSVKKQTTKGILKEIRKIFANDLGQLYQWQIEEITAAIAEADADDFASNAEVKATFRKLTKVN